MFESLSGRLGDVFDRLKRRGALREADVEAALRDIRVALLEADVALPVVKDFIAAIRERAVGQEVLKSVTPGQMVVKIVHDHLVELLGGEVERARPERAAAPRDPDGRPAGLGQDHHQRQARLSAAHEGAPARAAGLARRAAPGRPGAARRARGPGGSRQPADRARPDAGRDRPARGRDRRARGLRRGHPGHRRPAAHRRSADGRARGDPRPSAAARDAAGRRRADRPGRGQPGAGPSTSGSACPASC